MAISKKQSDAFWALKAFAIFTVFFAHMPGHLYNAVIFDRIGLIGVPLFMLCAGFFYERGREASFLDYFSKKLYTIIIPWIVWGTITFFIHCLKESTFGVLTYLKWILGIGTWLYFVPVLLCCQILFRYINNVVLLVLGLVSMFLSVFHIIPYNEIFTPYVNPFNFIGYFAIGNYLHTYDKWMSIKPIGGCGMVIVSILLICLFKPVYWYPYTLVTSAVLLIGLFSIHQAFNCSFVSPIGKVSFVIYLSHIQIAGFVNQMLSGLWGTLFEFLKVIVAFILATLLVIGLKKLLRVLKMDSLERYLGYR